MKRCKLAQIQNQELALPKPKLDENQPASAFSVHTNKYLVAKRTPEPFRREVTLWVRWKTRALANGRPRGDQLVVRSIQVHELVVRALLDHDAPRHHGDDVGVLYGGEAVSDDDARPALPGFVQRVLHRLLALRVQG